MSKSTEFPVKYEKVLSNRMDAWYIMAAITRDLQPYIEQFKIENGVNLTLDYFGWDGEESFAIYMNGHFCYTFKFDTYKPAIKTIGFDEEPLSKPEEHAVELILEPLVKKLLQKYRTTPVTDLANDSEVTDYFSQIATKRGYGFVNEVI